MKKKNLLITILAVVLTTNVFAQAPNWQWAKSAGGSDFEESYGIAIDGGGNSYVTGYFSSTSITFGTTTLTNAGAFNSDMFVVKYDAAGNVVWAKSAGGSDFDQGYGIAVDGSGNSYVTGYFGSTSITFGTTTLFNAGAGPYDMFVVKYDAAGNVVWAKSAGGSSNDQGLGIAVDGSGNSYVTGYFGSTSITFGTTTLTNAGGGGMEDMFVVKYDTLGNVVWAKSAGWIGSDTGLGIAVDGGGNSYVTGYFSSTSITFGTTTLTNAGAGNADMFVVKYDNLGNVVWAKSAGGSDGDNAAGIAVDGGGNSYVTGSFKSTSITFGTTTLTNAGAFNSDMFVVKYDAAGNVVWAKSAGGSDYDIGYDIAVDGSGNSYVTGYFYSTSITFGTTTLFNAGAFDMFVVKYAAAGNVVWAKSAGGSNDDQGLGIAVDGSGNSYVTGSFYSTSITFGTNTLTNAGAAFTDMFFAKLNLINNVNEISQDNLFSVFPNPAQSVINIKAGSKLIGEVYTIYDNTGRVVLSGKLNTESTTIELGNLSGGIYMFSVGENMKQTFKVIKE
jgi:Tfp pilus assembly protein PilZ